MLAQRHSGGEPALWRELGVKEFVSQFVFGGEFGFREVAFGGQFVFGKLPSQLACGRNSALGGSLAPSQFLFGFVFAIRFWGKTQTRKPRTTMAADLVLQSTPKCLLIHVEDARGHSSRASGPAFNLCRQSRSLHGPNSAGLRLGLGFWGGLSSRGAQTSLLLVKGFAGILCDFESCHPEESKSSLFWGGPSSGQRPHSIESIFPDDADDARHAGDASQRGWAKIRQRKDKMKSAGWKLK